MVDDRLHSACYRKFAARVPFWLAMRTLVAALTALLIAPASASAALKIDVVSNRADLVSAGDALVAHRPPRRDPSQRSG